MTSSQIALLRALTPNWPDTPQDRVYDCMEEKWVEPRDPRDPDPTKEGIFRDHRCWKCNDGERPCADKDSGNVCPYPRARND